MLLSWALVLFLPICFPIAFVRVPYPHPPPKPDPENLPPEAKAYFDGWAKYYSDLFLQGLCVECLDACNTDKRSSLLEISKQPMKRKMWLYILVELVSCLPILGFDAPY
jgi:hypothetical protein